MKDFQQVFGRFMERKEDLAARYGLTPGRPQWRENSNWAGLLIAIGNEYAPGNPKTLRQRQETIQALCARPDMAHAIPDAVARRHEPQQAAGSKAGAGGPLLAALPAVPDQKPHLKKRGFPA